MESTLAAKTSTDIWHRLSAILAAVPSCLIATDEQGVIQCANRTTLRLLDSTLDQLIGQPLHRFLPELDRDWVAAEPADVIDGKPVWRETTARRLDGRLFPVKHAANRLEIDGLRIISHVVLDISERKRMESALRESTDRVRAILETIPLAIVTTDQHGKIETFNLAAEPLFQCTDEEVLGEHIGVLIPALANTAEDARSLLGGGAHRVLTARRRDGSEFPVELGVGSMDLSGKQLLACVIKDITDRVKAENEAQTAREQLMEADKLASLGALVAGVAHEVNTPVGIGVTAASHLREQYETLYRAYRENSLKRSSLETFLEACDQSTRIIHTNLHRASELISSFKQLAVDRSSSEQRQFAAREFIDEVLLSLRPKLKRTQHRIEVDCPADLQIDSFPGALSQILTNFVMNSLNHAYDLGEAGCLSISIRDTGNQVEIRYQDNGRGINDEHLRHIFEPFFTTKRGTGGSGLGLHIVYNVVKKTLGGSIRCESEPGGGTRFFIVFPKP